MKAEGGMDPIFSYVTREPVIGYRVYGAGSKKTGPWQTPYPMRTGLEAKEHNVLGNWANPSNQTRILNPAGTRIQVGFGRPGFGYPGGQPQWLILDDVPSTSFSEGTALPPD